MPPEPSMTNALLARAHSPDTAAEIFANSIAYRPLLLRASSPPRRPSEINARTARRQAREAADARRKTRPRPLSARERKRRGLYDLPRKRATDLHLETTNLGAKDGDAGTDGDADTEAGKSYPDSKERRQPNRHREACYNYAVFWPLHLLWQDYIREVLGPDIFASSPTAPRESGATNAPAIAAKLAAAEFHGAEVEVVRSACVSRVSIRGIVVKDTRFTFELVTPRGGVRVIPKEGTVFRVRVPGKAQGDSRNDMTDAGMRTKRFSGADGKEKQPGTGNCFVFDILGDQFLHRPADRASRKFKQHFLKKI